MTDLLPRPRTRRAREALAVQIEQAYAQLRTSLTVNILNGLIVVLIFWDVLGPRRLLAWLLALYAVTLLRYLVLREFEAPAKRSRQSHLDWGSLFMLGALASGLVWGTAGIVLFHPTSVAHQIFLAFVLGGMIAGALPLLSAIVPAFPLFAIPVAIPIMLELATAGTRLHLTMALLVLIFLVAMLVSSARFSRVFRESIELRIKLSSSIKEKEQEALLARIDTLTGIANRRLFDEALASEWRRAQRTETRLSLLIADIDHFKRYNDQLGHPAGDACLKKVAASMATAARRPGDLAARIGGEEFAFILPNTGYRDAGAIAERIREDILALQIPHPASPISDCVTISLGVAELRPKAGTSPQALIQAADDALYRAKSQGRNQVVATA
ncbi:GGDEF domain-containing protein [Thiorhodococcus minor]|uniref:diguanylate cyclase n=1 Tax=Thiorhodococcus minor TaxID=57489 RepID=A0A6M0JZG0_9GAMM|nr:diguanylate cyclase [Thiorhodococcus minor]NEV61737.1 GGDEF domain-containing protein [Thiorhodococcus minor]